MREAMLRLQQHPKLRAAFISGVMRHPESGALVWVVVVEFKEATLEELERFGDIKEFTSGSLLVALQKALHFADTGEET